MYFYFLGFNPILQATFTFAQMYFIFTYSSLMINKFKLIARFGLMHLVATNICIWIRTLGKETLQVSFLKGFELDRIKKQKILELVINFSFFLSGNKINKISSLF